MHRVKRLMISWPRRVAAAGMTVTALLVWSRVMEAHGEDAPGESSAHRDSATVVEVIDRYHRALAEGDSATALSLLAPDAVILESGGVETRAEYRAHHLLGDIQFARAVRSERGPVRVTIGGDVAWSSSTSTVRGQFQGRAINSAGAELMVLSRDPDGWKIRAIHWSSRPLRPAR